MSPSYMGISAFLLISSILGFFLFFFLLLLFFKPELPSGFQHSIFLKIFFKLINLFTLAVLGLRFCARAFSSCSKRGPLFIAVRGPLTIAASLVAEHRLQMHRLSNRGSRAQLLCGMWDLPRPGLEPVSPALAGRFSTTAPPGKPSSILLTSTHLSGKCQRLRTAQVAVMGVLGQAHVAVASVFHSRTLGISNGQWYPRGGGRTALKSGCLCSSLHWGLLSSPHSADHIPA